MHSERLQDLFVNALELEPAEREVFLAGECGGDPQLLHELRALLASDAKAAEDASWKRSALEVEAWEQRQRPERPAEETIGPYRLEAVIGSGGMGKVYRAVRADAQYQQAVAIKLIRGAADTEDAEEIIARFRNERQILANLQHPNIARLLDGGATANGHPYLVMEYIAGEPLDAWCEKRQPDLATRLRIFRQVCAAVHYAHQHMVIHRDLKPGNILVTADGEPKLVDFGISKVLEGPAESTATATGFRMMTLRYASPEQVRGEPVTTASDVYSLGVILYELLAGRSPYGSGETPTHKLVRAVCEDEPPRPSAHGRSHLRGDLDNIVLMALRKDPEARYHSADQFAEDIHRYQQGFPVNARSDTLRYRAIKFVRRNRISVAGATLLFLTLTAGIISTLREARVAERRFGEVRRLAHSVLFDYHDAIASLPGSTAVRGRLVTDALAYLDGMVKDSGGDVAFQVELASAYIRVGDVQGRPYSPNLGQSDGAMASYRKGLAVLEPIAARHGGNREALRQMATAYERIGNLQLRTFHLPESEANHRKSLAIREQLLSGARGDTSLRRDVAASYLYLGDILQAVCSGRPDIANCLRNALSLQQKALAMREELAAVNPADAQFRRDVAQAHMRIGFRLRDLATLTGDRTLLQQTLEAQRSGLRIREELAVANPSNARDRRDLADQRMILGAAQAALGDRNGAIAGYRESVADFQSLSAADPSNAEARRDLAFAYLSLAKVLVSSGRQSEGLATYERSLALVRKLFADDPNSLEDRQTLASIYLGESQAGEALGDFGLAIRCFRDALQVSTGETMPAWAGYYNLAELQKRAASGRRTLPGKRREYQREYCDSYHRGLDLLEARAKTAPLDSNESDYLRKGREVLAGCREKAH